MTPREQLVAYLATLGALVVVFISALIAAGRGVSVGEAFGLGTITGGLIGILRIPTNRQPEPAGTASDPSSTKEPTA
ncbi:hypothetical protein [Sphingomonas parapaucimobilis]|uniref:Uncharacterized protein n=1 Tax=Sphingomonas parapaucimobilis NBRC 15100 TaxID=1219049 RepID=A0A0A1W8R6_9SPHN|nr:hypothetical protein [Sphingomonas parapaucimobilis]GAM01728.1 hypothetical protein SP5_068_00960 [Sphingomonas parapaucimobilis NBRC 15100]